MGDVEEVSEEGLDTLEEGYGGAVGCAGHDGVGSGGMEEKDVEVGTG